MEQQIHITLRFHLVTGKVNLNEVVYRLQELKNSLMLSVLEKILRNYDDLIAECLSHHGAAYLKNLTQRLFTHVEIWLRTGMIAPKMTSLLERIFLEIGRRIKRIAWG